MKSNPLKIPKGLLAMTRPIDSLRPSPTNANDHPADNLAAIKRSLVKFGQLKAIVAKANGEIQAGNGTWLAAKEIGATHIAVLVLPTELEPYAEEFALLDNQSGKLSDFNPARLQEALNRLKAQSVNPVDLGFSDKDLQAILARIKKPASEASNWETSGPVKRRSKSGDVWAMGSHRMIVADCRDTKAMTRLMDGRKAQMVFTDPPYGVDYEDAAGRKIKNDTLVKDHLATFLTDAFKAATEVTASDASFYVWHASRTREEFAYAIKAAGLEERQYLIWAKPLFVLGHADYQWSHEPCFYASKAGVRPAFYGGRAQTTVWRISTGGGGPYSGGVGNRAGGQQRQGRRVGRHAPARRQERHEAPAA